jgi:hypothetical protein
MSTFTPLVFAPHVSSCRRKRHGTSTERHASAPTDRVPNRRSLLSSTTSAYVGRYVRADPQPKASFWGAFCACRLQFAAGLGGRLAAGRPAVVLGVMAHVQDSSIY